MQKRNPSARTAAQKSTTDEANNVNPQLQQCNVSSSVYIFFRKDGFYPIELFDDEDAIKNAEYNKGTIRVEDLRGRVVWEHCC